MNIRGLTHFISHVLLIGSERYGGSTLGSQKVPHSYGISLSGDKLSILCSVLTLMINPTKMSYSLFGGLFDGGGGLVITECLDLLLSLVCDLGSPEEEGGVLGLLENLALGFLGSLRGSTLDVLDQFLDVLAVLH